MSRAQGARLDEVWYTLTTEEKTSYAEQLANALVELWKFTSPVAQKVDGSPLSDNILGICGQGHPPTCKTIGNTTDEWFDNIADELCSGLSRFHRTRNREKIEKELQKL